MIDFPELRQVYTYDCGASALCSILTYLGYDIREEDVMKAAGTTEDGTTPAGIARVLDQYAVEYSPVHTLPAIRQAIEAGRPVLLAVQAWADEDVDYATDNADGHYVVAIGTSPGGVIFEDPSSYTRTWLTWSELKTRWHDIVDGSEVRYGLAIETAGSYSANRMVHMG
jgi:predicted double-glycine peptidase